MKKFLLGLAALATLGTSSAALADHRNYPSYDNYRHYHHHHHNGFNVNFGVIPTYRYSYPYNNGYDSENYYYNYGHQFYTTGYYGPVWPRADGYYACRKPYPMGTFGILTDAYGEPISRYTPYQAISRSRLRCR